MYVWHILKERLIYRMSNSPKFLWLDWKSEYINKIVVFSFQELQHIVRAQHIRAEKGKHGSAWMFEIVWGQYSWG